MHPLRRQRLQIVILIIFAGACASALIIYALGQNANFFYTPTQIEEGQAPKGTLMRAGGMVVEGSVKRDDISLAVEFSVTDGAAILRVRHIGILPDLFAEGEAAIAAGRIDDNNILQATEVLAKHDEKYMPPEVADSMNATYQSRQEAKAELK